MRSRPLRRRLRLPSPGAHSLYLVSDTGAALQLPGRPRRGPFASLSLSEWNYLFIYAPGGVVARSRRRRRRRRRGALEGARERAGRAGWRRRAGALAARDWRELSMLQATVGAVDSRRLGHSTSDISSDLERKPKVRYRELRLHIGRDTLSLKYVVQT